jgi:YegS/Rv2252/BmrU family lipid kinase
VFACGGDGTVNEVANGLAGSDVALGLVRGGMGNVFAKEIGAPRSPEAALRVLLDGERARFDLGTANGRHFLLMAGLGFDAAVVRRVPPGAKRRFGSTSYVLWGVRELLRYHPRRVRYRIDGEEREEELFWLLLGNTRSYGGVIDIAGRAVADDGLLEAYAFADRGPLRLPLTALRIALRRHEGGSHGTTYRRVRRLEVLTAGWPVQADGEYFGETPMTFSISPRALVVLLPRGRGRQLLTPKAKSTQASDPEP